MLLKGLEICFIEEVRDAHKIDLEDSTFVAATLMGGDCIVLCFDNYLGLVWRSTDRGLKIYDIDNNYKLDTLHNNDKEILLTSFSYYFIFDRKTGIMTEKGWNK